MRWLTARKADRSVVESLAGHSGKVKPHRHLYACGAFAIWGLSACGTHNGTHLWVKIWVNRRSTAPPHWSPGGRYWCRSAHIDATATPFPENIW